MELIRYMLKVNDYFEKYFLQDNQIKFEIWYNCITFFQQHSIFNITNEDFNVNVDFSNRFMLITFLDDTEIRLIYPEITIICNNKIKKYAYNTFTYSYKNYHFTIKNDKLKIKKAEYNMYSFSNKKIVLYALPPKYQTLYDANCKFSFTNITEEDGLTGDYLFDIGLSFYNQHHEYYITLNKYYDYNNRTKLIILMTSLINKISSTNLISYQVNIIHEDSIYITAYEKLEHNSYKLVTDRELNYLKGNYISKNNKYSCNNISDLILFLESKIFPSKNIANINNS